MELLGLKIDVLVTIGTPGARAAKQATKTLPVVVAIIGDAVAAGIVPSLARPGGNITGTQFHFPATMTKRIELLRDLSPRLARTAVIWNAPNEHSIGPALNSMEVTARSLKIDVEPFAVRTSEDFAPTVTAILQRRHEAVIVDDHMLRRHGRTVADLALRGRLPSVGDREYATDGGLLAYAPNRTEVWRGAATLIDKIFRGTSPADLPFQQADRIDLLINLKTAKALGLTMPPSLLARADHVIEW